MTGCPFFIRDRAMPLSDKPPAHNCLTCFDHKPKAAQMTTAYIYLILAIISETIGTVALQASQQFTRLGPSVIVVIGYALSFYLLAYTLKYMQIGIVYAIWSGLGIVFIAMIAYLVYGQKLDLPAVLGISMILAGILIIHLFSNSATH